MSSNELSPSRALRSAQRAAKTKSCVDLAKEELICPLCMDFFSNPLSLQCLHSYCETCLVGLHRSTVFSDTLACPECRATTRIPPQGIRGLKTNFKLKRFVEILTKEEKEEFIRKVSSRRANSPISTLNCSIHTDKPLEYYCETCRKVTCGQCMLDKHRSHENVEFATEVVPHHIEELKTLIPRAESAISQGTRMIEALQNDADQLCVNGNDELLSVHLYFVGLQKLLKEREKEIIEEMQAKLNKRERSLYKRREAMQKCVEGALKCKATIEDMVENRSGDINVLVEEPSIRMRLEAHAMSVESEMRCSKEGTSNSAIDFSFVQDPDFGSLCKTVGEVSSPSSTLSPLSPTRHFTIAESKSVKFALKDNKAFVNNTLSKSAPTSPALNASFPPGRSNSELTDFSTQKRGRTYHVSSLVEGSEIPDEFRRRKTTYSPEHSATIIQPDIEVSTKNLLGPSVTLSTAYPHGLCVGKDGVILVTDIKNCVLRILVSTGRFLEVVGSEGKGDGQFVEPTAVATDKAGNIYVVDKSSPCRIQKFSSTGKFVTKFKTRGLTSGAYLGDPLGIAAMSDGCILVTDNEKSCVHQFEGTGKYVSKFGAGDIRNPAGIVYDPRGRVIITDRGHHCVWIFTPSGQLLTRFGHHGNHPGDLHYPYGVTVDVDGNIYISESGNHRISKFTAGGKFVKCFGRKGSEPGMFQFPRHLCIDSQGRLIVADERNQRLQIFNCTN